MEGSRGASTAAPWVPDELTLSSLRSAARECRGCHLWESGTQTVFGAGTTGSEVMLIGEQPGDQEDRSGEPFVGPAGRLLDKALESAGIDRAKAYVTNAVKHFKWEERGKRRIHKKPNLEEVLACKPWLEAEVQVVGPRVIVTLGATAAQSLLGKDFRVTKQRGELFATPLAEWITATVHPSSILRARDGEVPPNRNGGVRTGSEGCSRCPAPALTFRLLSRDRLNPEAFSMVELASIGNLFGGWGPGS